MDSIIKKIAFSKDNKHLFDNWERDYILGIRLDDIPKMNSKELQNRLKLLFADFLMKEAQSNRFGLVHDWEMFFRPYGLKDGSPSLPQILLATFFNSIGFVDSEKSFIVFAIRQDKDTPICAPICSLEVALLEVPQSQEQDNPDAYVGYLLKTHIDNEGFGTIASIPCWKDLKNGE